MRVFVPYSGVAPTAWTEAWAYWYCRHAEPVHVGGSRSTYARAFAQWWEAGEPFAIVEHDVVPWPGAIEVLEACPELWCAFSYYQDDRELPRPYLGCVRFRPQGPPPFEVVPDDVHAGYVRENGLPHWQALDLIVAASLHGRGWQCHQHFPAVAHVKQPHMASVGFLGHIEGENEG